MDVQVKLDEVLADNPELQKYVTKLYYVPEGATAPADATHTLRLNSTQSVERHLTVGAVVKPQYVVLIDSILAMIATQP